jgi:GNAT superfamily N-acetyltransferase
MTIWRHAPAIASTLYQAFVGFRHLYTPAAFSATAIGVDEVLARLSEGPGWVALNEERICGTVSAVPRNAALYVRGMAVLPNVQGKGVGFELLQRAESFALENDRESLLLTTTSFLDSAIRLYARFGFSRIAGDSADFFGTPILWMEKKLGALRTQQTPA